MQTTEQVGEAAEVGEVEVEEQGEMSEAEALELGIEFADD